MRVVKRLKKNQRFIFAPKILRIFETHSSSETKRHTNSKTATISMDELAQSKASKVPQVHASIQCYDYIKQGSARSFYVNCHPAPFEPEKCIKSLFVKFQKKILNPLRTCPGQRMNRIQSFANPSMFSDSCQSKLNLSFKQARLFPTTKLLFPFPSVPTLPTKLSAVLQTNRNGFLERRMCYSNIRSAVLKKRDAANRLGTFRTNLPNTMQIIWW